MFNSAIVICWLILFLSSAGIFMVFIGYPLLLVIRLMVKQLRGVNQHKNSDNLPTVSVITVSHKTGDLLNQKLENVKEINYPPDRMEFIFFQDGAGNESMPDIKAQLPGITAKQLASDLHNGKAYGLNKAVSESTGDILIFSDVDSIVNKEAFRKLVRHFTDQTIGGVCGQRTIRSDNIRLKSAQTRYLAFDNLIKRMEGKVASLTSNEGKLYAIRRNLFKPIDPAATDDLYNCLSVVEAGYRFVFEPEAVMFIRSPSRNAKHEVDRRRRVVTRSLHGIAQHRKLLNPTLYGWYSFSLLINKLLRRCLPLALIGLFASSLVLARQSLFALALLLLQAACYCTALLYPLTKKYNPGGKWGRMIKKPISLATYFLLGNYGTLLGLTDFLKGKRVEKWTPIKSDD